MALRTLATQNKGVGSTAAQFIASVAAIELPRNQWPELMPTLVENVGQGSDSQKQSSLTTIGFVCDTDDVELREALGHHSNAILTAVVQGARKEETNNDVRVAAINALSDSIEFVRSNFDNEGERNYIMQVICEATQADDNRIQQGSYGCLNRIMGLYYDKMRFYMEKALFGLTIQGMKSDEEDVAKLAVEFWCTVCEEEIAIEDDNTQAQAEGSTELREYFNFARVATQEVVPVLLELLAKQDEDADDNEYNTSRAAYQCLQLWAQCVGSGVMPPVLAFIEKYIRSEDWHYRDASVSAFGAIMEGPEESVLDPIVKQALPTLIGMMEDQNIHVKDSAAYALGRICEAVPSALDAQQHLPPLIGALFNGLASNPKMAASCCWSLMNLADRFAGEPGCQTNPLSPHFAQSVQSLLQVTERGDADNQLRTAAYEVLNSFVNNAAGDSVPLVNELANVILERLEKSMALQSQIVNVEDKLTLEEMQTSLSSVIMSIIQRMESDIRPQADRIMQALLSLLSSLPPKSSVPDTVFAAIGSIATALEDDFQKYMEAFTPFLYNALNNQEEPALCSMAIGLVADITRSLGANVQPFCDAFMNSLLNNLRSPALGNQLKPAILQCFGDIAHAIHGAFETYLPVVAQVLQQAGQVTLTTEGNYEMIDYITSLREGIMDAWDGCIVAMKSSNKSESRNDNLATLILTSPSSNHHSIPRLDLRPSADYPARQQPHRSSPPIFVWCYWVNITSPTHAEHADNFLVTSRMPSRAATLGSTSDTTSSPQWRGRHARTKTLAARPVTPPDGHANRSSAKSVRRKSTTPISVQLVSLRVESISHPLYVYPSPLTIVLQAATRASWPECLNTLSPSPSTVDLSYGLANSWIFSHVEVMSGVWLRRRF
jgi:importin subunit beta-1